MDGSARSTEEFEWTYCSSDPSVTMQFMKQHNPTVETIRPTPRINIIRKPEGRGDFILKE